MTTEEDTVASYAAALDSDISSKPWQVVRNRVLVRGHVGTIYGKLVSTERAGFMFDTRAEAVSNAKLARELCQGMMKARETT